MNKLEWFTNHARRVMGLAQEETERLHHGSIETQHLLFGLIAEEGGVAGRVLRETGLNKEIVRNMVSQTVSKKRQRKDKPPILSPGSKRILELALDEARRMGHHYVGTEHLLLGLTRLSEGGAIEFLKRNGIDPENIRRETRRILQQSTPTGTVRTGLKGSILHVVIRDAATNEQKAEFTVGLAKAHGDLFHFVGRVLQGEEVQPVEWLSGDNLIELIVEKAED